MKILETKGPRQLTIDEAAKEVGLTKGSFYHHFAGRAQYQEAILASWNPELTRDVIDSVEPAATPARTLQKLLERMTRHPNRRLEIQIRAWAQYDPIARKYQERVDADRRQYMADILCELGISESESAKLSRVLHVIVVGALHVMPSNEGETFRLLDELIQTHVAGKSSGEEGP